MAIVNVALATNGGTATASSTHPTSFYLPSNTIKGSRYLPKWMTLGCGWNDNTQSVWPDWLQVDFNQTYQIDTINVITVQDDLVNPINPTLTTTFTLYGITAFDVQYWTGAAWQTVTGGSVAGK